MKVTVLISLIMLMLIVSLTANAKIDPKTIAGLWLFDEDKGDVAKDSSGNKNDGKIMNGPNWVDGKFGKALSLNGVNQYVSLVNTTFWGEGQQTLAMWAKPNQNPPAVRGFIFSQPVVDNRVYILQEVNGNISVFLGTLVSYLPLTSAQYLANQWFHIVITRDYDNKKFNAWVNGVQKITNQSVVIPVATSIPSQIGATSGTEPFNGLIDEVAIFNTVLSEGDIKLIVNWGIEAVLSGKATVDLSGKLTTTWASVKAQ